MKASLIILIVLLLSCQSRQGTKKEQKELESSADSIQPKKDSATVTNATIHFSFIDSISKKYELSIEQMNKHTMIDSFYYTGRRSDVSFVGDTIFTFHNSFIGAIIDYDDKRNCIYKFLFVFNPVETQNTDYKKIQSDCDRDESSDYLSLKFKLLNDSIFQTIESYTPKNTDKVAEIERQKWKVNNRGAIDSLR